MYHRVNILAIAIEPQSTLVIDGIVVKDLLDATSTLDLVVSDLSRASVELEVKELIFGGQDISTISTGGISGIDIVDLLDGGTIQLRFDDMLSIIAKGEKSASATNQKQGVIIIGVPGVMGKIFEISAKSGTMSSETGNTVRR